MKSGGNVVAVASVLGAPGSPVAYTLSLKVKPCSSVNATFDGHVIRVGPAAAETLYDDR